MVSLLRTFFPDSKENLKNILKQEDNVMSTETINGISQQSAPPETASKWNGSSEDKIEQTSNEILFADTSGVSGIVADLIANNPAFGAFKETQRKAASNSVTSKACDVYDVLATMLGVPEPARMNTPVGDIPLQSDWLHKDDIYALMRTPAYQTDNLPQSNLVRDTVTNFFRQAYPGMARRDATGRPIQTPTVSRPKCAPRPLQGKRHLASHGRQKQV